MVQIDLLFATQNPGVQVGGQAMEINKNDCIVNLSYNTLSLIKLQLHYTATEVLLHYSIIMYYPI